MKYFSFSQKWENAFSDHISFATRFVMFDWEEASLSTSLGATNVKPLGAVHDVLRVNLTDTRSTHCAVCSKHVCTAGSGGAQGSSGPAGGAVWRESVAARLW